MYIELDKVSRGFQVTNNSVRQTFVYVVCDEVLDEDEYVYGEFFAPNDDIALAKFVYATFPVYRVFPINAVDDIILVIVEYACEDLGGGNWKVTITYSVPDDQSQSGSYVQFGVEIGGDSVHIAKCIGTRSAQSRIGLGLLPPETNNIVGLTRNSIEGADILSRGLKFTITNYYQPSVWTPAVLLTWSAIQSTYNNAVFYGFAAGEVQFVSVSAQGEIYKRVPVTFNFKAQPNFNGVADLPFPPLYGLGHDVVDYLFGEEISENYPVKGPFYRYVRQVYNPGNFALLGL